MDISDASFRRRMAIEDELLSLLQEVPYEQISVLDIAQRQNIARKTFYRYFPNKQACLEGLMDRLIYECNIRILRRTDRQNDERWQYEDWLEFWKDHQQLLSAVVRDRLDYLLVQRMAIYTMQEESFAMKRLHTKKILCDEDVLVFYLSGQVALLLKWSGEGFSRPVKEMVDKLMRLNYEPLLSPIP